MQKYLSKVSGPLMDRIDIQIEIAPVPFEEISKSTPAESSSAIRSRVIAARARQTARFADFPHVHCNAQMTAPLTQRFARPDEEGMQLLKKAMERFGLSARAYDRILKVARTIADLAGSENITAEHIREAILYRNLDRASWGAV